MEVTEDENCYLPLALGFAERLLVSTLWPESVLIAPLLLEMPCKVAVKWSRDRVAPMPSSVAGRTITEATDGAGIYVSA